MEERYTNILGYKEIFTLTFWRAIFAEVLVSCIYIIIVCGAGLKLSEDPNTPPPSLLHVSITVGLTVGILASGFWEISGGHFNPAVSLALTLNKTISVMRCVFYVAAQCLGSAAGAALLQAFTPAKYRANLGALFLNPDLSSGVGFLIEMILTFVLIWTVLSSTDPKRGFVGYQAPVAIGLSVTIGLLMGIPYTGASLNPIRAFGPAVVYGETNAHWIYWLGPFSGAITAVVLYDYILKTTDEQELAKRGLEQTPSTVAMVTNDASNEKLSNDNSKV